MTQDAAPLRIAMWSGPRNISTAMMRAWENRGDCAVSDEPLYAHYLAQTGFDHPARDEVIAAGEPDWRKAVAELTGPIPDVRTIWYQKHMSHHLLPQMTHDWIHQLSNAFLIRDPNEVVSSYLKARPSVTPEDIGLPQQVRLFDEIADRTGSTPPVIDSDEFLGAPEAFLRLLCDHFGIPFSDRMLHWPAGSRASDGVWAPHWYATVWQSTSFAAPNLHQIDLDDNGRRVADACRPHFDYLAKHRMRIL